MLRFVLGTLTSPLSRGLARAAAAATEAFCLDSFVEGEGGLWQLAPSVVLKALWVHLQMCEQQGGDNLSPPLLLGLLDAEASVYLASGRASRAWSAHAH